jgi:hypothetical protein
MPEHFIDPAMDMISKVMLKRDKLQAKVDELEKENQRLRGLLVELLEFRKRDDRGDPDYMPSDWWYDEVWSRVEKEVSDG